MPEIGEIPGGGRPFGNIFTVSTPHVDQLAQQVYLEQKQREVLRQRQSQALDEEFRKNVANIKDADIPEYTKKYQDWKKSRQELMRVKPKNQEEFIAKQMEVQRRLADVYTLGNASKQAKDEEEELAKDMNRNPNNYDDNAFGYLSARRKMPYSQLQQYKVKGPDGKETVVDLTDANTYRYKGSNTDFGKLMEGAIGVPRQVYQEEEKLDGGLQFKVTPYMYGNSPSQVKDRLLGSFALRQAGRDAEHQWDTIPEKEKIATIEAFKAIPAERWKKMGIENPQDLMPKNADNKAEKLASHMAMQYALSNEPKQGTPVFRDNKAEIDKQNFEQQKQMETIRDANARRRIAMQDSYAKSRIDYRKAGTKKEQEGVLQGYIERAFEDGKDSKGIVGLKGNWVRGRKIAVPVEIVNKYTKGTPGKADEQVPVKFIMTEDKKYVIPVYAGDKDSPSSTIRQRNEIPIELFRNDLGKVWLTKKDATAEMADELDFGEDGEVEEDVQVSAPVQDDRYTRDELKSAGWTDEKINTAVKAGKIKLK